MDVSIKQEPSDDAEVRKEKKKKKKHKRDQESDLNGSQAEVRYSCHSWVSLLCHVSLVATSRYLGLVDSVVTCSGCWRKGGQWSLIVSAATVHYCGAFPVPSTG